MGEWSLGNFNVIVDMGHNDDSDLDVVVKTKDIIIGRKKLVMLRKCFTGRVSQWIIQIAVQLSILQLWEHLKQQTALKLIMLDYSRWDLRSLEFQAGKSRMRL